MLQYLVLIREREVNRPVAANPLKRNQHSFRGFGRDCKTATHCYGMRSPAVDRRGRVSSRGENGPRERRIRPPTRLWRSTAQDRKVVYFKDFSQAAAAGDAVVEPSTVCFQWIMNHTNFGGCCLENLGLRPRSTRLQRKAGRCSAGKAVCDPDKAATTFSRDEPGPGADAPNLLVTNAVQVEAGRLSSCRWKTCNPIAYF
jgi:hypothetical protein